MARRYKGNYVRFGKRKYKEKVLPRICPLASTMRYVNEERLRAGITVVVACRFKDCHLRKVHVECDSKLVKKWAYEWLKNDNK